MKSREPNILIWDLETDGMNSFKPDLSCIVNFGYKWLGEKKTHCLRIDSYPSWFKRTRNWPLDDSGILRDALKIMERADLLVAHFGDKFDRRFLNSRCAMKGFPPPPPTKQRDTWRIAKTAFNFSSNRLGALASYLGVPQQKYQKNRDEFPGWWLRVLAGDWTAVIEMSEYCKQDVRTLEQVYLIERVYDNPHPRMVMDRARCALCGGDIRYRGLVYAGQHAYRQFYCKMCHKWGRETKKVIWS
jgi:hypothetical protein